MIKYTQWNSFTKYSSTWKTVTLTQERNVGVCMYMHQNCWQLGYTIEYSLWLLSYLTSCMKFLVNVGIQKCRYSDIPLLLFYKQLKWSCSEKYMKGLHNQSERKHQREGYVCDFLLPVPENSHSCFCSHRRKECVSLMSECFWRGKSAAHFDLVSVFLRCSLPWLQPIQNACTLISRL